jgi:hypothetical protein
MADGDTTQWQLFGGSPPPEEVVLGLRQLGALPAAAFQNLWALIEVTLAGEQGETHEALVQQFCQRYSANPSIVITTVRTCEFVLRRASAIDLSRERFVEEIGRMAGSDPRPLELLGPRYDGVRPLLRTRMLEDTLADYGNVLTGFDWRLDRVDASTRGTVGGVPVVYLNLRYRNGAEEHRFTVQLPPRGVAAMRGFLMQLGIDPDGVGSSGSASSRAADAASAVEAGPRDPGPAGD